ncbi:MAG: GNAT family N-acetyltransferase [Anaerolineales bacterium]
MMWPAPIRFRPARLRDLSALRRLEQVCFDGDAWGILGLTFELLHPAGVNVVAACGPRIVGAAFGEAHLFRRWATIASLAVHPDFRRNGLGTRLLESCEALLKRPFLYLTVRTSNRAALNLYEKLGYVRAGVRRLYYAGGEDAIEMTKTRDH